MTDTDHMKSENEKSAAVCAETQGTPIETPQETGDTDDQPAQDKVDAANNKDVLIDGKRPRWYVVHAFSGSENRVVANIKEKAAKEGIEHLFLELLVPQEEVTEVRRGVKRTTSRAFFSGYVLVRMVLSDATMHLIRSIDRVTGFLGDKERPAPLSSKEVERLKGSVKEAKEATPAAKTFLVGQHVKVVDGPFKGLEGLVEMVQEDRSRLKVSAMVFGRATPIEVGVVDVEKS